MVCIRLPSRYCTGTKSARQSPLRGNKRHARILRETAINYHALLAERLTRQLVMNKLRLGVRSAEAPQSPTVGRQSRLPENMIWFCKASNQNLTLTSR